jgi:hypothetical protein
MKTMNDSNPYPVNEQSLMDKEFVLLAEADNQPEEKHFEELLSESGFEIGENGICLVNQKGTKHIANIFNIQYLYNKMEGNKKIRFIKLTILSLKLRLNTS